MVERFISIMIMFACSAMMFAEQADSLSQKADTLPEVEARIVIAERDTRSWISSFGHVALHLRCEDAGLDYAFSFETDYEVGAWRMLRGEPSVLLMPIAWSEYKIKYLDMGRRVNEYGLNLTPDEKRRLWELVDLYVKKGNYLSADLLEHGCSEEMVALIKAAINGRVEYDKTTLPGGNTPYELGKEFFHPHSPMRLITSLSLSSHALDLPISDERKVMFPDHLHKVLSGARIIPSDGSAERPFLLADVHEEYVPKSPLVLPVPMRLDWILYVLIVLTFAVGMLEIIKRGDKFVRMAGIGLDTTLLGIYTLITLAHLVLLIFCKLPSATGWDWDLVAYNGIPLLLLLISMARPLSVKTWMTINNGYLSVLSLFLLYMILMRAHFVYEQALLIALFELRCVFQALKYIDLNKNN